MAANVMCYAMGHSYAGSPLGLPDDEDKDPDEMAIFETRIFLKQR